MTDNAQLLRATLRNYFPKGMYGQCDSAVAGYFAVIGKPVHGDGGATAELTRAKSIESADSERATSVEPVEVDWPDATGKWEREGIAYWAGPTPRSRLAVHLIDSTGEPSHYAIAHSLNVGGWRRVEPVACDSCREKDGEIKRLNSRGTRFCKHAAEFLSERNAATNKAHDALNNAGAAHEGEEGRAYTVPQRIGRLAARVKEMECEAETNEATITAYQSEFGEHETTIATLTAQLAEARQGVEAWEGERGALTERLAWVDADRIIAGKNKMVAQNKLIEALRSTEAAASRVAEVEAAWAERWEGLRTWIARSPMGTSPSDIMARMQSLFPAPPLPVSEQPPNIEQLERSMADIRAGRVRDIKKIIAEMEADLEGAT